MNAGAPNRQPAPHRRCSRNSTGACSRRFGASGSCRPRSGRPRSSRVFSRTWPAVSTRSIELFGQPADPLSGGGETNLDAARFFLALADELDDRGALPETDYCIPAATLRNDLQREVDAVFGKGEVRIEVGPSLTAKAAAGTSRIRLRGATRFSGYDRGQILAHEAFVHTVTARNGRARIYRGVPLTGGAAFTKDHVYLAGLLTVHTFARWALKRRRPELIPDLFAGKLALDHVIALQPCFTDSSIAPPTYLPEWVRRSRGLAGKLALSTFANRIRMGRIGDWS